MDRICRGAVFVLLFLPLISGCGSDSATQSPAAEAATKPESIPVDPSTQAVTKAAADFLDAILKGDSERAKARLTPKSLEQITQSGKHFGPPGQNATFQIGQVRMPSPDQALVQCELTDQSSAAPQRAEKMLCLMKRVENDWRVCGIAYGTAANQPWTLTNFETGQSMPISRQPGGRAPSSHEAGVTRPSPPRTAQEPAGDVLR